MRVGNRGREKMGRKAGAHHGRHSASLPSPRDTVAQEDLWNGFSNYVHIQAWGGDEIWLGGQTEY